MISVTPWHLELVSSKIILAWECAHTRSGGAGGGCLWPLIKLTRDFHLTAKIQAVLHTLIFFVSHKTTLRCRSCCAKNCAIGYKLSFCKRIIQLQVWDLSFYYCPVQVKIGGTRQELEAFVELCKAEIKAASRVATGLMKLFEAEPIIPQSAIEHLSDLGKWLQLNKYHTKKLYQFLFYVPYPLLQITKVRNAILSCNTTHIPRCNCTFIIVYLIWTSSSFQEFFF